MILSKEIPKRLNDQMTLDNARAWEADQEKFCFCTEILDSLDLDRRDDLVDYMESCFEQLLNEAIPPAKWVTNHLPKGDK